MIKTINKLFYLFLFCITSLNAQLDINQLIFNQNDSANVQFFFNEIPDSIKINGEPVSLKSGQSLKLGTGIYAFEAFKKCFFPVIKKDTLISIRPKQIYLDLNPLIPPEKSLYDISLYTNIIALPILNTIMITNNNYNDYILPIATTSIVQLYWHWKQSDKMKPCSEEFIGQKIEKKDFCINFGISTQILEQINPGKNEVSYDRPGSWYTHKYDQELELSLKSSAFISNFSLFAELRKYFISPKIFAELYLHSIFGSKIKFHVKESYPEDDWREGFARDYQAEISRKYPVIVEVSTNYELLSIIDQTFILSLGGYWGNPFVPKDKFLAPVQQQWLHPQVYENPEEIKYSQNSFGIKMGLSWETPLNDSFIYNLAFKWYSSSSKGFTILTSSFKYALW